EAGREGDAVLGPLERGEADLQCGARGIRDPGVVVALVLADRVLDERRRLVDRHGDRAGSGIRLLPAVGRARLEVHGPDFSYEALAHRRRATFRQSPRRPLSVERPPLAGESLAPALGRPLGCRCGGRAGFARAAVHATATTRSSPAPR